MEEPPRHLSGWTRAPGPTLVDLQRSATKTVFVTVVGYHYGTNELDAWIVPVLSDVGVEVIRRKRKPTARTPDLSECIRAGGPVAVANRDGAAQEDEWVVVAQVVELEHGRDDVRGKGTP